MARARVHPKAAQEILGHSDINLTMNLYTELGLLDLQGAVESLPPSAHPLHPHLLNRLGIPIGELWDLDALADACAADGVYDFMLTSAPMRLRHGVASPPHAFAVTACSPSRSPQARAASARRSAASASNRPR